MPSSRKRVQEALRILVDLDMPRQQRNERSALSLLALVGLRPRDDWAKASSPLVGITPIMEWARGYYGKTYKPNTRESVRRQTMHQFVEGGIALYNPDNPARPVNSPKAVYQIEPACLALIQSFGRADYSLKLEDYKASRVSLAAKYAKHREMKMIPVDIDGREIVLSPGEHSELIRDIWQKFAALFVPGGELVYVGDTGNKWGYFNDELLKKIGVTVNDHGKMPDVAIYYRARNWLVLAEAVTSHGPVDGKRHNELNKLFAKSKAGLVFVSAFPNRKTFTRYAEAISWETEVWIADNPTHLIHYNGLRFLGPYS